MGQKVSPIGFRIGIRENWKSNWYSNNKKDYARFLLEDQKIRKFIKKTFTTNISSIKIERTRDRLKIQPYVAKPALIIGHKGSEIKRLKERIKKIVTDREIVIDVKEVPNPNVDAQLVGENIAEQLLRRTNFRRAMKKAVDIAMESGVLGIKVQISGRLAGAEMARVESTVKGKIPLQTLDANVQYGFAEAMTTYGTIGIKVWIYHGRYDKEVKTYDSYAKKSKASKRTSRPDKRKS